MTREQKIILFRIGTAALLLIGSAALPLEKPFYIATVTASYLVCGYSTLWNALYGIYNRQLLDENFLMAIATIGAIVLGEYQEAVGVMLFYLVGTFFESYAVNRSRKSISEAMDIRPEFARLIKDGKEELLDPYEISVGDIISVRPGEKIPLDGTIVQGQASLDTSPLTGESLLKDVNEGDQVISGCLNSDGLILLKVSKEFDDSTVAKILELVETASTKKAKTEKFITRFAQIYTPIVVALAVLLALLPTLVFHQPFSVWVYRALLFLVISCPCALVISVPLSFFGGMGAASAKGILVKGGVYLEIMSYVKTILFDKTGTLTYGQFKVTELHPVNCTEQELITAAAHVEYNSNHPLAKAIVDYYIEEVKKEGKQSEPYINTGIVSKFEEIPGKGSSAMLNNKILCVGNEKLMKLLNFHKLPTDNTGTSVHVAADKKYMGYIVLADVPRKEAVNLSDNLHRAGMRDTVMLTGDNKLIAEKIGEILKIDKVFSNLLPNEKVSVAQKLKENLNKGEAMAFVGDGINDAPVLSMADLGIAMGGLGSDAAVEAADVVILDDDISKLLTLKKISKKTIRIAKENIVFALGIKIAVLILGALGIATMWLAIFADVGVSILAITNSLRTLFLKNS